MMDESSTLLHRRKEKSVCCVCVCVRDREEAGSLGTRPSERSADWHRYSGALRTQKVRRGPERVVAEEYVTLIRAKAGAGGTRDREERPTESDQTTTSHVREDREATYSIWCDTHSRRSTPRAE